MSFKTTKTATKRLAVMLLSLGLMSTVGLASYADAATNDFDGDGNADVISVKNNVAANTSTFNIRFSSNGNVVQNVVPLRGDAFYTYVNSSHGPNETYYAVGVVRVVNLTTPLLWMKKDFRGNIAQSFFGLPGDVIPAQTDVDKDGRTDRTVVRNYTNGALLWITELSSTGQIITNFFGETGDSVFTTVDGQYGVLRNRPSSNEIFVWFLFNPLQNQLTNIRQWGLDGDIPLIPLFPGEFAIARTEGTRQRLYVRRPNGNAFTPLTCLAGETPNLGSFFTPLNDHMVCHNRAAGAARAYNVVNNGFVDFPFAEADHFIVGGNRQVFPPASTPPSGGGGGGGEPPTNPGLASRCPTTRSLLGGEIWKSIASGHISSGDPRSASTSFITRAGTPAPVFQCLEVFDRNGNLLHKLGRYYPNGSAYSARLYGGSGCGTRERASVVASRAIQNTGSPEVYLKLTPNSCARVPNANICYNSTGC